MKFHRCCWNPQSDRQRQDDDNCEIVNGTAQCWRQRSLPRRRCVVVMSCHQCVSCHGKVMIWRWSLCVHSRIMTFFETKSCFKMWNEPRIRRSLLRSADRMKRCEMGWPWWARGPQVCAAALCVRLSLCRLIFHVALEQRATLRAPGNYQGGVQYLFLKNDSFCK